MRRAIFFLLLGFAGLAHGQGARKFSFRTLCFTYVDQVTKLYLPNPENGGRSEVPLFTEVYSLPAAGSSVDGKVTFYLSPDAPTAGKPVPSLPPVAVPESGKILFLFLPNPGKKGEPYRIVAMADDTSSFPLGSVKILNLTAAQLRFDLGEHAEDKGIPVAPGKTVIVDSVKKVNHLNQYDAKVLYALKPGEFTPFYNSRWRSVDAKRDIAIVYLDPVSKQPMVNLYEDAPPAEAPKNP
jgi:hypothetical protein